MSAEAFPGLSSNDGSETPFYALAFSKYYTALNTADTGSLQAAASQIVDLAPPFGRCAAGAALEFQLAFPDAPSAGKIWKNALRHTIRAQVYAGIPLDTYEIYEATGYAGVSDSWLLRTVRPTYGLICCIEAPGGQRPALQAMGNAALDALAIESPRQQFMRPLMNIFL